MKMKDVGPLMKAITEQANDPNARDPFEPLPYDDVYNQSTADEIEQAKLLAEQKHIKAKIASLKAKVALIDAKHNGHPYLGVFAAANRAYSYNAATKAVPPAGHVQFGTNLYNLSMLPQRTQDWLQKYGPVYNSLVSRDEAITRKVKALKKKVTAALVTATATAAGITMNTGGMSSTNGQIPIAQIPQKVKTSPTSSSIDNPYFKSGEYAGPPSGYAFSTPMRTIFVSISATLKRHGLSLGPLYVGRHGGAKGPINFITATANNKFVWRKYDAGGGSGQNHIYLNGHKMNTSSFMNMSEAARDGALKANNVI